MKCLVACTAVFWCAVCLLPVAESGDAVVVASGTGSQAPKQPQAAVGDDGSIHVVWGVGDSVQYCRSTDSGQTFEETTLAFRVPNMSLGMRRGPRISVTPAAIIVTAIGGQMGKGRDGDLVAWRSSDLGKSWQGPVRVNDAPDSAREGLHAMTSGPDGSVWCAWLDLRDQKTELYTAVSKDAGATWGKNQCIYRSPDGSVCECCHPSISVTKTGISVLFRNSISGARDMFLVTSSDGGTTFTDGRKLGDGTWKLDACPMDGGMLSAGPSRKLYTVWRRDNSIYSQDADAKSETLLGHGQQPWVAASAKGPYVVWTAGREGTLLCSVPNGDQPIKLANSARDPVVVTGPSGDGPVFAFWESKDGSKSAVMATRLNVSQ